MTSRQFFFFISLVFLAAFAVKFAVAHTGEVWRFPAVTVASVATVFTMRHFKIPNPFSNEKNS